MIYGTLNESDSISPSDDKDAIQCQNEGCNEGFIYLPIWNEDENKYDHEKEKCPYCEDGFIND